MTGVGQQRKLAALFYINRNRVLRPSKQKGGDAYEREETRKDEETAKHGWEAGATDSTTNRCGMPVSRMVRVAPRFSIVPFEASTATGLW